MVRKQFFVGRLCAICLCLLTEVPAAAQYLQVGPGIDSQYLHPGYHPAPSWTLGVRVSNTETGVRITSVVPGSSAALAGLEAGDSILTVAGQQVGYVNGRLVDLGDAINRATDAAGNVVVMIQDVRTAQVANVPIQLGGGGNPVNPGIPGGGGQGQSVLQGQAIYQQAATGLSRRAVLTVRLLDVTHAHWNRVVIAETSVANANRAPVIFRLPYDARQVYRDHNYALEAEVTDQGQVTHRTATPVTVSFGAVNVVISLAPVAVQLPGRPDGRVVEPWNNQVSGWYQQYLGRQPTTLETATWHSHVQSGRPLDEVQAYLLGSPEYYERARNSPQQYVTELHRSLHGTEPTPAQQQQLLQQLEQQRGVRSRFVQQLLSTPER